MEVYWIPAPTPGRLAVMPRPRGGDWLEDEVRAWKAAGVDVVLSLLTPSENAELALADERVLCEAYEIEFLSFPITDRGLPPAREPIMRLCRHLAVRLIEGKDVAIHCRQGLGRAPLAAICVLVLLGLDVDTATKRVSAARGCSVPETPEQEQWVSGFAKETQAVGLK